MAMTPKDAMNKRKESLSLEKSREKEIFENAKAKLEKDIDSKLCGEELDSGHVKIHYWKGIRTDNPFYNLDNKSIKELSEWAISVYTDAGWVLEFESNYDYFVFIFNIPSENEVIQL